MDAASPAVELPEGLSQQALIAHGWELHHARDWDQAVPFWAALAARFPADPEPSWAGGLALREAGRLAEAETLLAAAVEKHPADVQTRLQYAWVAHARADWPEAIRRWEQGRKKHPREPTSWWAGGEALRAAGQLDAAAALLTEAVKQFPKDPWCRAERLNIALAAGNPDDAFRFWCAMRDGKPPAESGLLRVLAVRVLWLQPATKALPDLLRCLLAESPLSGDVPSLWQFARDLRNRERRSGPGHELGPRLREALAAVLDDPATPVPFAACHAVAFHLPTDPAALLDDARELIAAGRAAMLGCLRDLDEVIGRLLVAGLAYETAIAPARLPVPELLEMLRLAAAESPDGFETLLRRVRALPRSPEPDESSAQGTLNAAVARFRLPEDMPAPPYVTQRDRKLRIALCVSGQLRGYRQAYLSWRAAGLDAHEVVTVVHAWRRIGRPRLDSPGFIGGGVLPPDLEAPYDRACRAFGGVAGIAAQYPSLHALLDAADQADPLEVEAFYDAAQVVLEDDGAAPFRDYSNQEKMFYKLAAAQQLATRRFGSFDLCIRIRPDKEILTNGTVDWHHAAYQSRRRRALYNDSGIHYVMSGLGVGDQFAFGAPELMNEYAGVWQASRDPAKPKAFGAPGQITGHSSLAHHLFLRGIRIEILANIWGGRLYDAEPIDPADIAAALRADIGPTPRDAVDAEFLSALSDPSGR